MRLALPIIALLAFGGAATSWLLQPREPDYCVGAERMYENVCRVRDELRDTDEKQFDHDLYEAQMYEVRWKQSLSWADSRRKSVTELSQALGCLSAASGNWQIALLPRMEEMCAQLLDESARDEAEGDKHLGLARRLLDAGK